MGDACGKNSGKENECVGVGTKAGRKEAILKT
jgi:hypothetical protein